jgi:hypothetical protein
MTINFRRARSYLEQFEFRDMFIEELGWNMARGRAIPLAIDGDRYHLSPAAELGGVVVYQCETATGTDFPDSNRRRKIEKDVAKLTHEHIVIFVDARRNKATWMWVKREAGAPTKPREQTYNKGQSGDLLLSKLAGIAFKMEELDAEGHASILAVTGKLTRAFDVERITKRFYDQFKTEHSVFIHFMKGIDADDDRAWYTSVMLNRLMFIYFIEKKSFLDGDIDYLKHKLEASKTRGKDRFYSHFLATLFFDGFAHEKGERSPEVKQLLGNIPYLNGGLFQRHQIEEQYAGKIRIPDTVFDRLFKFFDNYTWYLDDRPLRADNEINPDVLGYIFEKYINQKQMGAYYSKEDITGYICRNAILPFLLEKLGKLHRDAVHPLPLKDIEPYIFPAVKQSDYLPTETEREYAARQKRLAQIRADFKAGKIAAPNDFITYNLDIKGFVPDFLRGLADPLVLRDFYFECLRKLTVLDPTVGSGAFLFAAMNILEPLYEICLDKMAQWAGPNFLEFSAELKQVDAHPNRAYFIFKRIIVDNLYGVDIMGEAVEICKLRLFLKLVAQVDDSNRIEPLPDIDFNIRAGNTLVGYASRAEVEQAATRSLFSVNLPHRIHEADIAIRDYRELQTRTGITARELAKAKADTQAKLKVIENELNEALRADYGAKKLEQFVESHRPFHWYVEFNQIMQDGGFDVIVGNPPYVEYSKVKAQYTVRWYETESCGNLFPLVIERSYQVLRNNGSFAMIIQHSGFCTPRMQGLIDFVKKNNASGHVSYYECRPGKLFEGIDVRLAIPILQKGSGPFRYYGGRYFRFFTEERPFLFQRIQYVDATNVIQPYSLLKIETAMEESIANKMFNGSKQRIADVTLPDGEPSVFYSYGFRYWAKVLNFRPYFQGENAEFSTGDKHLCLKTGIDPNVIVSVLNSSLFFWYYSIYSDGHNFTKTVINDFPFDYPIATVAEQLSEFCNELMVDLKRNARLKTAVYKTTGEIRYEEYYAYKSKSVIDEIDRTLARHYGLTDNELDFIINYDIKYRMGKDDGEEE